MTAPLVVAGQRVLRIASGETGVVLSAPSNGSARVAFPSGDLTVALGELQAEAQDPTELLPSGDFGDATAYGLRLQLALRQVKVALSQAGLRAEDVDLVVRTGGSSSISAFRGGLGRHFPAVQDRAPGRLLHDRTGPRSSCPGVWA